MSPLGSRIVAIPATMTNAFMCLLCQHWSGWWQKIADIHYLSRFVYFVLKCFFWEEWYVVGFNVLHKVILPSYPSLNLLTFPNVGIRGRQWHPTPVLLPAKSHGWRSLGLQSMGSLRVRHDWGTSLSLFTFMHWRREWQPTPVFLPGESQGRGSLAGCHLLGRTDSDTTEET